MNKNIDKENLVNLNDFKLEKLTEELKNTGPITKDIFYLINSLEARDWEVTLYNNSLAENTAYADYTNKKLLVNVPSAYYAKQVITRVYQNSFENEYKKHMEGSYFYKFEDGEKLIRDDESEYYHLYLSVCKCVTNPTVI